MRKNFRHLKPCLKRNLKLLENNFYVTKTRVFYGFRRKDLEKKPRASRGFLMFLHRIVHQKMLIG